MLKSGKSSFIPLCSAIFLVSILAVCGGTPIHSKNNSVKEETKSSSTSTPQKKNEANTTSKTTIAKPSQKIIKGIK